MSSFLYSLVQTARERLRFIFSQSAYFFEKPEYIHSEAPSFQDILLDLSCYHCDNLVQGSLHLLNRSVHMGLCGSAVADRDNEPLSNLQILEK